MEQQFYSPDLGTMSAGPGEGVANLPDMSGVQNKREEMLKRFLFYQKMFGQGGGQQQPTGLAGGIGSGFGSGMKMGAMLGMGGG